jgi:hypothetical protein
MSQPRRIVTRAGRGANEGAGLEVSSGVVMRRDVGGTGRVGEFLAAAQRFHHDTVAG